MSVSSNYIEEEIQAYASKIFPHLIFYWNILHLFRNKFNIDTDR